MRRVFFLTNTFIKLLLKPRYDIGFNLSSLNMTQWTDFKNWLQERLQQPLPGYDAQRKMMTLHRPDSKSVPTGARQSGVLILMYPDAEDIKIVLIERSVDGGVHSGQIALPGGKKEDSDKDIIATALREANEEIALNIDTVQVLGRLSSLYIPVSNFEVNPVIGFSEQVPTLIPSEYEVARIVTLSINEIFTRKEMVKVKASGVPMLTINTIAYLFEEDKFIWGATAMILAELENLWEEFITSSLPD